MQVNDYSENWPRGWIKLYRSIRTHWIFENEKYFRAWIIMLLEANITDEKVLIDGELIDCKRGQKLYSLDTWAKKFGNWSIQNVRTFFKLLTRDNMIIQEGLRKTTRVTICNYETYQSKLTDSQQTPNKHLTDSQQQLKNKENDKKEKKLVQLPFSSETFKNKWDEWTEYKKTEHRFSYKSERSLKAAFTELINISGNNEQIAMMIIDKSMANGYKGLFPLKENEKPSKTVSFDTGIKESWIESAAEEFRKMRNDPDFENLTDDDLLARMTQRNYSHNPGIIEELRKRIKEL